MSKTVTLDPGESAEVVFIYTPPEAGIFHVRVGDELDGQFEVTGVAEGVVLHGVITHLGVPVAGATVQLDGRTDTSIDNGQYHFSHVVPGRYILSVNATGYESYSQEIDVLDQEYNRFDIELSVIGGGALYGRVTDAETGAGIEGIRVDTDGIVTHTNVNGCYSYASLGAGTYYMDFTDPQGRYYMKEVDGVSIGAGEKEVNVQLEPTGIIPGDLIPFRGKFASPWNGEKFDTIKEMIDDGGGCRWTGDPYYSEGWYRNYTGCPYCGQMFDYTWREDRPVGDKREQCMAIILEHINNAHRLICTPTEEDFTWSAKAEDRYDFFASECELAPVEPMDVEVVPLAANYLQREYGHPIDEGYVYVDNYYDWWNGSTFATHGAPISPDKLKEVAGYYPHLYKATQIVEGPMCLWRRPEEGGEEGYNKKFCGKWGNYNVYAPGCGPSGLKMIIPGLADKDWTCYIDEQTGINIATFEGSGSVIKWRGNLLNSTQGLIVRIEFDDQCLIILYPYASWGMNLAHQLSHLERHYRMNSDQLDICKDCLLNIYNRLHGVTGPYAVPDNTQAIVKEGGQAVLDRDDCRVSSTYYGYPRFEHTYYCNWTPSEVNSKYNQKRPALDAQYEANVAEVERLIALYESNWEAS